MIVLGEAAHPLPVSFDHHYDPIYQLDPLFQPGGVQGASMAIESGAVLAKVFSHLSRFDQIRSFLFAYEDIRKDRVHAQCLQDTMGICFMTMEECETQRLRDDGMRALHKKGRGMLEDSEATEQWESIKATFAYDCEDEADNWYVLSLFSLLLFRLTSRVRDRWVSWGLLRERANMEKLALPEIDFGVLSVEEVCNA